MFLQRNDESILDTRSVYARAVEKKWLPLALHRLTLSVYMIGCRRLALDRVSIRLQARSLVVSLGLWGI